MTKSDPIIAVKDVAASSAWYQSLFGCKSMHGGSEFDILVTDKSDVILCLHKWGEDEHPTMQDASIPPGNGLILYFRTAHLDIIRQNAKLMNCVLEADIQMNANSRKKEFSLRDLDGYYITISEYHNYQG